MADFLGGMDSFSDENSLLSNFISGDDSVDENDISFEEEEKDDEPLQEEVKQEDNKEIDADVDIDLNELEEEDIDEGKDSQQNTSNSQYSALISAMGESLPFLQSDNLDIKTPDEFMEYVSEKMESELSARELADLNETQRKYLEALRAGVPEPQIQQNLSFEQQINSISEDDIETNEELRENLIYQAFRQDGLSDERARKLTRLSIDGGADIEDAKESLDQLKDSITKQLEEQKQANIKQQEAAKKAYDEQMKQLQNTIDAPKDVLGTETLTENYKKELHKLITKPQKAGDKEVNFLTKYLMDNPVEGNIVLAHLYLATDGFKADKIKDLNPKAVKSKATKDLSKIIEKSNWNFSSSSSEEDFNVNDLSGFGDLRGIGKID